MRTQSLIFLILLVIFSLTLGACTSTATSSTAQTTGTTQSTATTTKTTSTTTSASTPTQTTTNTTSETSTSTPTGTILLPSITGLIANNAYDGKVNLWWNKVTSTDFDCYAVYINTNRITDVSDMKPVQQIKNIDTCRCQITGLENGTNYYFAVTAVDKNSIQDIQVTSVNATPNVMIRGTVSLDLEVSVYQPEKIWAGTTVFTIDYDLKKHLIVEVNMLGEIIWQYMVTDNSPSVDAELLPNNNIIYGSSYGAFEIDRKGKVVWQYLTNKMDHDIDRLDNGNTIFVFGMSDQKEDPQVVEVNQAGQVVWEWYAADYFNIPPYDTIYEDGSWVHTNAVTRLENGNTLISLTNFDIIVEVDPQGDIVRTMGGGAFYHQHDPEIQPDGNFVIADHNEPNSAIEYNPVTGKIVWKYMFPKEIEKQDKQKIRDANRLPNGNTLVVGSTIIAEVTPNGEIVWRLNFLGPQSTNPAVTHPLYKAYRISP